MIAVRTVQVTEKSSDQRLDNFLLRELKGVPRTRIYRLIRRGEVRVNKKRAKPETRLTVGDKVRIPPLHLPDSPELPKPSPGLIGLLEQSILHEDANLLVLNKPAGLAVHLGTGIRLGLIEAIRQIRRNWRDVELAHRLDRDTSGVLIVCKNPRALRDIQGQFKEKRIEKRYHALVQGQWPDAITEIKAPLIRVLAESGERFVRVDPTGKPSATRFRILEQLTLTTLLEAIPVTGRTHQIRVHCQHAGHPIIGDPKYSVNTRVKEGTAGKEAAAKYLCLHAAELRFQLPGTDSLFQVSAPWDKSFAAQVSRYRKILSNSV
ncbi:MAG: RluA family pseudouridine synthase [Pseudomonadota bacterium]|nr:RluA family pseudouridine synthase [Gammaproteobacteria bacterium]MEC7460285.1 RluA family pseudouridine synthase [Pseudomonadota bacterium]MEC8587816.1 RluA family pseudouridine synthase [Pseudomonadota bacterium]